MPHFKEVTPDDIKYFLRRCNAEPDVIHVNSTFPVPWKPEVLKRYVYKQIEHQDRCEVVEVSGECILSSSPKGRSQVCVTVYNNNGNEAGFVLQHFKGKEGSPVSGSSLSFFQGEFQELLTFLGSLGFIDFSNPGNYWLRQSELGDVEVVTSDDKKILDALKSLKGTDRKSFLERLTNAQVFTDEDLNVISGRRTGLNTFREQLYDKTDWDEKKWQVFFEENPWIFGYGLDYKFLSIVQREAAISNTNIDQSDTSKTDFLMSATDFTVLVEMKEPKTQLFRLEEKVRSRAWGISTDLMDAISQILAQKAEWLVKSRAEPFHDKDGRLVTQKTIDPKAILIVGMRSSLEGTDRDQQTKLNTFELFRRDSRNIEIITYDELYDRAFYIVNQDLPRVGDRKRVEPVHSDDIPF